MGLSRMTPEFGSDSQMWIYMHDDYVDINGTLAFEVSQVSYAFGVFRNM